MLRKLYTIAFVGVMASGQAALAGNQTVVITEGGFFPEITYLKPGDAVEFVNRDEVSHTVSNADGDWSFTIEPNAAKKYPPRHHMPRPIPAQQKTMTAARLHSTHRLRTKVAHKPITLSV